jgi:hypothetical protein
VPPLPPPQVSSHQKALARHAMQAAMWLQKRRAENQARRLAGAWLAGWLGALSLPT